MEFIVGIIVSLIAQTTKKQLGANTSMSLLIVLVLSMLGAIVYVAFSQTSYWPVALQVLTVAGAFYAFIIKRFEES